jgi:hypothetical protein
MGADADNPRVAEEADGDWVSVHILVILSIKVDSPDKNELVRFSLLGESLN